MSTVPDAIAVPVAPAAGAPEGDKSAPGDAALVAANRAPTGALPKDWKTSTDRSLVLQGDATGLHVLVADQADAYAWRTVTTLNEPGIETDQWVGNGCLTGSAKRAVVVYAPRSFTNDADLFQRGAFGAVIDLETGSVQKLSTRSTLAYYNPGCGAAESAVLTQQRGTDIGNDPIQSRLIAVDAATGSTSSPREVNSQLTSAVPVKDGIAAVKGSQVVTVKSDGQLSTVASVQGLPFHLVPSPRGALTFMEAGSAGQGRALRLPSTDKSAVATELAKGPLAGLDVVRGAGGSTLLLGEATKPIGSLPADVRRVKAPADAISVSTDGDLAILSGQRPDPGKDPNNPSPEWVKSMTLPEVDPGQARPVQLKAEVVEAQTPLTFNIDPDASRTSDSPAAGTGGGGAGATTSTTGERVIPALRAQVVASAAASASTTSQTIDTGGFCSVPRNDPNLQIYQPTPRQVEWAVNQAVVGNLNVTRPANWMQSNSSAAWSPQGLFPKVTLQNAPSGSRIPSQILLGILAQESNLWQATGQAPSGVPGNPLIGNYYGRDKAATDSSQWNISFTNADCGYGIGQVTDGMRKSGFTKPGETALSPQKQKAVVVDYATNIAAAATILSAKWNQVSAAGMRQSNGDPKWIENWFYAVWAYNSGFYPDQSNGTPWGLGWLNNSANPNYDPSRTLFNANPSDAARPQNWSYPEKVMGWAAYSIATPDGPGFRPSWWTNASERDRAQPPLSTFCTTANDCYYDQKFQPNAPAVADGRPGPCAHKDSNGLYDLKCWWHGSVNFHDCSTTGKLCGNELLRFDATYPEQDVDGNYSAGYVARSAPNCTRSGLPSNAIVVDDVPTTVTPISSQKRPCSSGYGPTQGTFALDIPVEADGQAPARIDLHQIGAGFGGHFWFSHTRTSRMYDNRMAMTGTWTFNQSVNSWGRVLVHMPDIGAHTQQAKYLINDGAGRVVERYTPQRTGSNRWVSLGVVNFAGTPKISLSTVTWDGYGEEDVAWDAVAIQPLPAKPTIVVGMGDSYSSGEGASRAGGADYYPESDYGALGQTWDACRRSKQSWQRKVVLPGQTTSLGAQIDTWGTATDFISVACSGATTDNMTPQMVYSNGTPELPSWWLNPGAFTEGTGQNHEVWQTWAGYLDANTDIVMFSIGGNDADFAGTALNCLTDCKSAEVRARIDTIQSKINNTVTKIKKKAPNARVVVVGYPRLFTVDGATCNTLWGSPAQVTMNDLSDYLSMKTAATVAARPTSEKISFADPRAAFNGHGVCGGTPFVNNVSITANGAGDATFASYFRTPSLCSVSLCATSRQTLHPNTDGTTAYATVVSARLAQP